MEIRIQLSHFTAHLNEVKEKRRDFPHLDEVGWLTDNFKFSDEEVVEMLAETVERALGPRTTVAGNTVDAGTLQDMANALNQYMDQEVNAIKEMQKEVEA